MTDKTSPIIKQLNDEEMVAIEWLYLPPNEADLHDEGMTAEEIVKMVDSFNDNMENIEGNIAHCIYVDEIKPEKAWVNPCDCFIGEQFVPEGSPLVKVRFFDEELWEQRKSGVLKGVSIGARGERDEQE